MITDQHAEWFSHHFNLALDNVQRVLRGKRDQIATALISVFAQGHLLLEDVPGTGKTVLARSIARSLDVAWGRIQFTPDLLPSDVTGGEIYDQSDGSFRFRPGPVFAGIVLADEINRASPKTQAALLEVMEERHVTVGGVTHAVPDPFVVIATQNPVEQDGTYPLPEAQLDRFLLRSALGYPDLAAEADALKAVSTGTSPDQLESVIAAPDVGRMIAVASAVHVDDAIYDYVARVAAATRERSELRLGVSTRGGLALVRAAKAMAATQGRPFVTVDDVRILAPPALGHRMLLTADSELRDVRTADIVDDLLERVPTPEPVRRATV